MRASRGREILIRAIYTGRLMGDPFVLPVWRGVRLGVCGETAGLRANYAWLTAWPARGYIAIYVKSVFKNPILCLKTLSPRY